MSPQIRKNKEERLDNYGQMFFTGVKGLTLSDEERDFIKEEKIGGIILFSENFQDPSQLAELVNSIQKVRDDYPLFIGVDHEGGRVQRFKTHFSTFPSMNEVARLDSPKTVFEIHQIMARELAACGINLSFSPDCDILTNPKNSVIGDRAYGSDAASVEKFISGAIRGLQTSGLLSCAKHFPGHGDTTQDSHFELPLVKTSLEVLKSREMIPFVKASKSRVEFMMMAHLLVDAIDEKNPTSLSEKAYELLRRETKFTKIVITDDLDMKAISDRFTPEVSGLGALLAGADMVMFRSMENAKTALLALREASKKRLLKKELLTEKLSRIEKTKKEYLSNYQPIYIPKISEVFHSNEAKNLISSLQKQMSPSV
jgi:beta-N-acetylhexosaminidase